MGTALYSQLVVGTPTGSASFQMTKKRQLPQVPLIRRSSNEQEFRALPSRGSRQWKGSSVQQRRSAEAITPMGMYSDSEINARPAYDRIIYAHPHRVPSTHQRVRRRSVSKPLSVVSMFSPEKSPTEQSADKNLETRESSDTRHHRRSSKATRGDLAGVTSREGGESGEEESETSSVSKVSVTSALSTLSERPAKGSRTLRYTFHKIYSLNY